MSNAPAAPPVALGLTGLRSYVSMSCLVVMAALSAQILVWSLVTFTDLRFKVVDSAATTVAAVQPAKKAAPTRAVGPVTTGLPESIRDAIELGPVKVRSGFDHLFSDLTTLSVATGSLALVVLLLLLAMGVNLMTASAMAGVDRAISSLIWAIIVAVIALPTAELLGLPWKGSALRAYAAMVEQIEAAQARGENFSFYASFLFMPALCLAGMVVIESRFRGAVRRNVTDEAHPFLDPVLEQEARGLKATSLHGTGGRSSGALNRIVEAGRHKEMAESVETQAASKPTEQAPSNEDNCRRLI